MGLPLPLLNKEYALGLLALEEDEVSSMGSGDGDFWRTVRRTRFIILLHQQAHLRLAWNPHSLTIYGLTHPRGRWNPKLGVKVHFLSIYANSAMTAVSLSGSFLSTLLFKLKNVPGDAVSAYLKYPSLVNPLTVLLSPRRGSCWAKSAVIKSTT